MNTCMCAGSVGLTVWPSEELSDGTSRQPSSKLLVLDLVGDDALDDFAPRRFLRHEQRADGVVARLRQRKADLGSLAREEGVRDLHQDAGAVACARIGADRAAVFEVAQDVQRVGDDLMRLLALDVGDEADAAGILFQRGIVETLGGRAPVMLARRLGRFRIRVRRQRMRHDVFALELRPAHLSPLKKAFAIRLGASTVVGAPWALRHPPGHRSSSASRNFVNSGLGVRRPRRTALPFTSWRLSTNFRCNPCAGIRTAIETAMLS
jgi:hypothetical protein